MNKVITIGKDEYSLVYEPKVRRAYDKELGAGPEATDEQVLAYYDKFGGLLLKNGEPVKNGEIWAEFSKPKKKKEEPKEGVKEEVEEVKKVKKTK